MTTPNTNPGSEKAEAESRHKLTLAFCEKLGWTRLHYYEDHRAPSHFSGEPPASMWDNPYFGFRGYTSNRGYAVTRLPEFFVNANAALLLVEHMRKEGWEYRAALHAHREDAHAFQFVNEEFSFDGIAPTLPLAICRAFAAANHIEP